jgi:hypothetical protein
MEQLKVDVEDRRLKMTAATGGGSGTSFWEKIAASTQDFQLGEQEIQAAACQRFQKTTDEFDAEGKQFQQRIAALEREIARSPKNGAASHPNSVEPRT